MKRKYHQLYDCHRDNLKTENECKYHQLYDCHTDNLKTENET